ncbi:MAG TPA: hypothetical protein VFC72_02690 [Corynebacterium sp.]|nr:hypothetical protein [Corynebacterium sp.]
MKKTILAAFAAALALTLTACGESTEDQAKAPSPQITATEAVPTGPVDTELSETVTLVQDVNGPRKVHLTLDDISVSDQCHHGLNGHTDPTHDDGHFIQITGEIETVEGERGYSLSEVWMTGTTKDGYAVDFEPAFPCENPDSVMDGYQSFQNNVIAGQKARGVMEFWASDLPGTITLTEPYEPVDYRWTVPEPTITSEPAPTLEVMPPEVSAPTPAAAAEPTIVECLFGTPGPTLMSDGTMIHTDYCFHEMDGPAYLESERAANATNYSDWYSTDAASDFREEQSEMIDDLNEQYSEYGQEHYIDEDGYIQLRDVTD